MIFEALDSFGGTWWTHRYPGTRSDSDLFTFGYRFKPWEGTPIATRAEILSYLGSVVEENDLARTIRYRHRITRATWSGEKGVWTIEAVRSDSGDSVTVTAGFLWMCQGYYRQSEGYTPDWAGLKSFKGRLVHPQNWPEDLDYRGKKVVIIGSGATAATLTPAIAGECEHVTVLQRSPTYYIPGRNQDDLADRLRALEVDPTWIHEIVRRQVLKNQADFTRRCFEEPEVVKEELLGMVGLFLPPDQVAEHFTPAYRPWRQRIAFIPDGDLFRTVAEGRASVVTGHIERFTPEGIRLTSGSVLEADIVVTATGFNLNVLGDIEFTIDGRRLDYAETVTYRGMMFTGVPNLALVFGYFRASWTLRADLVSDFVCRLLNHMDARGAKVVVPALRPEDADMELLSWIDPEDFNPGYMMRGVHLMPKRGAKADWQHSQDYWTEKDAIPRIDLDDAAFVYS